jgi:hypothetical protein
MIHSTAVTIYSIDSWSGNNTVTTYQRSARAGTMFDSGCIHSYSQFTQDDDAGRFMAASWSLDCISGDEDTWAHSHRRRAQ